MGYGVGSILRREQLIISSFVSANSSKIPFVNSKFRVFIIFFFLYL